MISSRKHNLGGNPKRNTLAQPKQHRRKIEGKGVNILKKIKGPIKKKVIFFFFF